VPGVVAIEQSTDELTTYIQAYRNRFVYSHPTFMGSSPKHVLVRCFDGNATPSTIYQAVQQAQVRFITGTGHGSYDLFTGQSGVVVWDALKVSDRHVRGKIMHLLSCQTGAILGLNCVQKGALAFWGYSVDFSVPILRHSSVEDNNVTNAFLRMDAIIDRGILDGREAQDIYDSVVRHFSNVYTQLAAQGSPWTGLFLDNFVHLVCPALTWGDPKATLQ